MLNTLHRKLSFRSIKKCIKWITGPIRNVDFIIRYRFCNLCFGKRCFIYSDERNVCEAQSGVVMILCTFVRLRPSPDELPPTASFFSLPPPRARWKCGCWLWSFSLPAPANLFHAQAPLLTFVLLPSTPAPSGEPFSYLGCSKCLARRTRGRSAFCCTKAFAFRGQGGFPCLTALPPRLRNSISHHPRMRPRMLYH